MTRPWESNPFRRCRARLIREDAIGPYWGRCDLRRGHDGPHCLERGMDEVEWEVTIPNRRLGYQPVPPDFLASSERTEQP